MDPITLGYYAAVCALLSAGSAKMRRLPTRLMFGAIVGAIAVAVLPMMRAAFGI
jgi:hypothetical protein